MRSVIVCVDDDWDILSMLAQQLKRRFGKRYDVEVANNAKEALLLCGELTAEGKDIPLIISDQQMQEMNGDRLLIELHERYPRSLKVMLTGQADPQAIGNVVNASALFRYMTKPWTEMDLVLMVSEALQRYQQESQLIQQNEILKTTNLKLNNSLSLLLATLESTVDGLLVLNSLGEIVSYNQNFCKIWNLSAENLSKSAEILMSEVLSQLYEEDIQAFQKALQEGKSGNHNTITLKDGKVLEYYLRPQQLMGETIGQVWSFRDISQEIELEAKLRHQALHDPLTNLPNRRAFEESLDSILRQYHKQGRGFCMMFLDVDHFKPVNDTYGHAIGDLLLQQVVTRFQGCLREDDVLARWGGDEFVLLLPVVHTLSEACSVAHRLVEAIRTPFDIQNFKIEVSTSIGFSIFPQDARDRKDLMHAADLALYQAKALGRNQYAYYVPALLAE